MDNNQFKPEEYGVKENFLNEIIALKNQNVDKYIPIHIQQHSKLLADLIIANAKPRADVYIFTEHFPHIFFAQAIEKTKGKVKLIIEQGDINPDSFKKNSNLQIRKPSAVANFNNRKDAKILRENFINMWGKSY
jgi:hypothetical protein